MMSIRRTIMAVALLGFGSGFSLLFSSHILLTWMLDSGMGLEHIGWISCLSLPYLSSYTWMPILDYVAHCGGIQRRVLMTVNFLLVACFMWALSKMTPGSHYVWILLIGFCIALVSATQDHIVEAYRINVLPKAYYKSAVNISMVVFRVALIVAGGAGIVFAKYFSWSQMFLVASMIMVGVAALTYHMPKEVMQESKDDIPTYYKKAWGLMKSLKNKKQFLGALVTHRLGIFWLESMLPVLMVKLIGLSMMDVGRLYQWYGILGLVVGSVIVNYQVDTNRLPLMIYRCLLLQLGLYLGFYILTLSPQMSVLAKFLVFCECALQGVLATISSLWLIQKVNHNLPAFSISLWYGLGCMGRVCVGPTAAWVIAHLGWGNYMMIGMLLSGIPILLIRPKWSSVAVLA